MNEIKKLRKERMIARYKELYKEGLRDSKIMEILQGEFYLNKSQIYNIIPTKDLKKEIQL